MNAFQTIGVGATGLLAIVLVTAGVRRSLSPVSALFWSVIFLSASFAIGFPDLTVGLAHVLGIARGADLVFYCAILAAMIAFLLVYVRLRRIERDITLLTRELALRHPVEGGRSRDISSTRESREGS